MRKAAPNTNAANMVFVIAIASLLAAVAQFIALLVFDLVELFFKTAHAIRDGQKVLLPHIAVVNVALEVGELLLHAQDRFILVLQPPAAEHERDGGQECHPPRFKLAYTPPVLVLCHCISLA